MMNNYNSLVEIAKHAAEKAGEEILKIYNTGDFSIEAKADDSPLTIADKKAHDVIIAILEQTNIPILSEEGRDIPYSERKDWAQFWLVDPLDGTKEFIKKNGEFTVNIALIEESKPILGVVYVPVTKNLFWSVKNAGSFRTSDGQTMEIKTSGKSKDEVGLRAVASRSHLSSETRQFLEGLNSPKILSKGSSLKLLLIASDEADIYPRFGPTMEWDTAAADAIVREAGGRVCLTDEVTHLSYNKESLLNPYFIVLPSRN